MIFLPALGIVLWLDIWLGWMDVVRVVPIIFCAETVAVPFLRSWASTSGLVFFYNPSRELCQCIVFLSSPQWLCSFVQVWSWDGLHLLVLCTSRQSHQRWAWNLWAMDRVSTVLEPVCSANIRVCSASFIVVCWQGGLLGVARTCLCLLWCIHCRLGLRGHVVCILLWFPPVYPSVWFWRIPGICAISWNPRFCVV